MNQKNKILFIQRLVVFELEAISFILVVHLLFKWLSLPALNISEIIWLQIFFILMSFPLYYFTSKKQLSIWITSISIIWIITGYWLGVESPWLPMVLGFWRSVSLANVQEYLMDTYKRTLFVVIFLTCYFIFSQLYKTPIWWAIPALAVGSFGFTIIGMACNNLLEQLSWQPSREEWKRIWQNQFLFVFTMMAGVIFLVISRNKIIFLVSQVGTLFIKLVTFLLAPFIILVSKVITFLYSLLQGSNSEKKGVHFNLTDGLPIVKVKDTTQLNGLWVVLTIVVIICLLIVFVKLINNWLFKDKWLISKEEDWIEIIEQQEEVKKNSFFSFLKNRSLFRKKQDLDKIRLLYIDFLKQNFKLRKNKELPSNLTARDMMNKAATDFSVNMEDLQYLTEVYEEHRYGGKQPDISSVQKMKKAVENWLKS